MYKIIFYCPDTNFKFDGLTPDTTGMGGGKTAMVRMAKVLKDMNNDVSVYCNCNEGIFDGVPYKSLEKMNGNNCDVLIAMTSSNCSLDESINRISAKLKIIWIQGYAFIKGIKETDYDYIYGVSNYIKNLVINEWGLPQEKIFVTHNGFYEENIAEAWKYKPPRDIYSIVFASHPSKGLIQIVDIVKDLRQIEPRFHIDVFGGNKLWGSSEREEDIQYEDFVNYKGLMGQRELAKNFMKYNLMLALSSYPDTSSLTIHEAKKCGVIVIASAIGGNPEIIKDGYDGFLIKEDYQSIECKNKVIYIIKKLINEPEYMQYIRENAMQHNMSWNATAKQWLNHWDSIIKKKNWWNRLLYRQ